MVTEIVFVLDESGSMWNLTKDVIGGYNAFINEQKKLSDKAYLTTVFFNHKVRVAQRSEDIQHVAEMTEKDYLPTGMTALLDAIGTTIQDVKRRTRKKDKVLFVINTDGMENSSTEFSNADIKRMVEDCQKSRKWQFVFIGANMDAFAVGGSIGIKHSFSYTANPVGTDSFYTTMSNVTTKYRSGGLSSTIDINDFSDLK